MRSCLATTSSQRYYRLKAKLLGLDRLEFYDRFAPIGEDPSRRSRGTRRASIVVGAYADFAQEAGDIVERLLQRELDRRARPRRQVDRGVLRDDRPRRPPVRAHELHGRAALDPHARARARPRPARRALAQPLGLFNAVDAADDGRDRVGLRRGADVQAAARARGGPAPPAQPAGRADRGLDRDDVPADRDEPLRGRRPHRAARRRASSRPSGSRSSGSSRRRELFGDSVDIDGYGTWWSYIPHFIGTPGYVYAYAYGFLFALAIFRRYELEGDAMVEPYFDVLRAGGSRPPEELARDRRPRPHRPAHLGERDRRARRGARRGRGARGRDRPRLVDARRPTPRSAASITRAGGRRRRACRERRRCRGTPLPGARSRTRGSPGRPAARSAPRPTSSSINPRDCATMRGCTKPALEVMIRSASRSCSRKCEARAPSRGRG